jgi:hypothetical protein
MQSRKDGTLQAQAPGNVILRNYSMLVVELPKMAAHLPNPFEIPCISLRPPHTIPNSGRDCLPRLKSPLSPCNQPANDPVLAICAGAIVTKSIKIIRALVSWARRLDFPSATWRSTNAGSIQQEDSSTQEPASGIPDEVNRKAWALPAEHNRDVKPPRKVRVRPAAS